MLAVVLSIWAMAAAPQVQLDAPKGGWSTTRVIPVEGQVTDTQLRALTLVVNGVPFLTKVASGRFSQKVVVSRGHNTIVARAANMDGVGEDGITFFSQVPAVDVQIVLAWEARGQIIDLWVTDPAGERCLWNHRSTAAGGQLHDLYGGAIGLGPQTFTLGAALSGEYTVDVNYYASSGFPQTPIQVDVVLFEGTDLEERRTFRSVLTKTGDTYRVGSFTVAPAAERE